MGIFTVSGCRMLLVSARDKTNKQTDQTTTLCVQEVEIYLERWEVLGALVDVCLHARATPTQTQLPV